MKKSIYAVLAIALVVFVAGCSGNAKKIECSNCQLNADSTICAEVKSAIANMDSADDVAMNLARYDGLGSGDNLSDVNVAVQFDPTDSTLTFHVVKLVQISGLSKTVDTLKTFDLYSNTVQIALGKNNLELIIDDFKGKSLAWSSQDSILITSASFDGKVIPSYGGVGTPAFIGNQDARDDQVTGRSASLLTNLNYDFWKPKKMRMWFNKNTGYLILSVKNTSVSKPKLHPGYVGNICFGTNFNDACYK